MRVRAGAHILIVKLTLVIRARLKLLVVQPSHRRTLESTQVEVAIALVDDSLVAGQVRVVEADGARRLTANRHGRCHQPMALGLARL